MVSYFLYNALFVIIMNFNDLKQPCLYLVDFLSFNTNCSTDWMQQVQTLNQVAKVIAWKIL